MLDLSAIRVKIEEMAHCALKMWQVTHSAFMEHDLDLLPPVLEEENKLNILEKETTAALAQLGRMCVDNAEKTRVSIYADISADLELIGDYCKDILERVQIKIEEKLLFSEDAVNEYNELYGKTLEAMERIVRALDRENPEPAKEVLKGQGHIDKLVDAYRTRHNQRLIDGTCSPMACNMFLNMLDFTAAVYYHTKKIAKSLTKL